MTLIPDLFDYIEPKPSATAPYVPNSPTSKAAAEAVAPTIGTKRRQILDCLARHPDGLITEEIERRTRLRHQSASPRVKELREEGLIEVTGERRKTSAGYLADVYRLARAAA